MKADQTVTIVNGVTHPDPIASPATVGKELLIGITADARPSDRGVMKELVLILAAPDTETVTISVYGVIESTKTPDGSPDANTIFFLIEAGVVVTARGVPSRVTDLSGLAGSIYLRVTADTIAANAILHIIQAESAPA